MESNINTGDVSDPIFLTALSFWAARAFKNPKQRQKDGGKKILVPHLFAPIFLPFNSRLERPIALRIIALQRRKNFFLLNSSFFLSSRMGQAFRLDIQA
jgi:hypothetical protein